MLTFANLCLTFVSSSAPDVVEVTELQSLLDQAIQPTIGEGAEDVISRAEHQAGCALLNIINDIYKDITVNSLICCF